MLLGAVIFVGGDYLVDKRFGGDGTGGALGIVLGAVVDGIPESVIFGIQVALGMPLSVAFLFSVAVSNIPQALAVGGIPTRGQAWSRTKMAAVWGSVVLACGGRVVGHMVAIRIADTNGMGMAALAAGGPPGR
ncbi:MAG: hypothetical protein R3A10_01845 [Caldilineaceae bacterium]